MKTKQLTKAPKASCEGCSRWQVVKRRIKISKLLEEAIGAIETKLDSKELKPTIGDYLKLLQLEQEFEKETPKEIRVTWVEPPTESKK